MLTWRVSCLRGVRFNTVNGSVKVEKSRNVMATLHNRLDVIGVKILIESLKKLLLSFCTFILCASATLSDNNSFFLALWSNILQHQL